MDGINFLTKLSTIITSVGNSHKSPTRPTVSHPIPESSNGSYRNSHYYEDSSDDESDGNDTTDNADNLSDSIKLETAPPPQKANPQDMIEAEINYILETEDKYLKMLQSLEEDREDLSYNSPPFFRKWLSQLFRQIRPITAMHEKLLPNLARAHYDILKFSEAFMDLEKHFTTYVYYIENIPTVDKLFAEYSSYLKEKKPNLIDKLRQPRLRLNHYVLMLESLQKKVTDVEKCYLQDVINLCKKCLKEADKALLLGTIKGCPFPLTECGDFIHRSELKLASSHDLPSKNYHLVLLERKLIFVSGNLENFQFVQSIPVDEMELKTNARGLYFTIMVTKSDKGFNHTYKFKAKNIKVQQLWIEKLRHAIEDFRTNFSRAQGRASFGRSGKKIRQSFASARKYIPSLRATSVSDASCNNASDSDNETEGNKYWESRRRAVRKYSSLNAKTGVNRVARTTSSTSDFDDHKSSSQNPGMAPLTVWNFYEDLEKIYRILRDEKYFNKHPIELCNEEECSMMDVDEQSYVKSLDEKLKYFLENSSLGPPREIRMNIRRLYQFHMNKVLPQYSDTSNIAESIIQCLNSHGEEFAVVYSEYLSDRCSLNATLLDLDLEDMYVSPIHHFILYSKCVIFLRKEGKINRSLLETAASVLHDTITAANNCLLADCINNVPFALSQCQPILLVSRLKMRSDIKARQEYQVILLRDRLIILEIRPPLYNYFASIRLDSVCLGPSVDAFTFQLEYRTTSQTKKVYSFRAQRKDVKDQWMTEITSILAEQAIKMKNEHQRRLEEAPKLDIPVKNNRLLAEDLHTVDISKSPSLKKRSKPLETEL